MAAGDVAWWRWADARIKRLPRRRVTRSALAVFSGFLLMYLVAVLLLPAATRRSRGPVPLPVHAAAFLWHLLVLPVWLIGVLISWLSRQSARAITKMASAQSNSPGVEATSPSRREALSAAAVAIPPLLMVGATAAALAQLGDVRVRRFEVRFPQLPRALDGMTIAHVSDLHVGKFTRDGSLRKLAEQVNSMQCDFVAVTGDLIDLAMADLPRSLAMIRPARSVKRAGHL